MTKKIRLMDEEAKTSETGVADAPVDGAVADDVYKKQLMKYLLQALLTPYFQKLTQQQFAQ